jgi:hypothetical protein
MGGTGDSDGKSKTSQVAGPEGVGVVGDSVAGDSVAGGSVASVPGAEVDVASAGVADGDGVVPSAHPAAIVSNRMSESKTALRTKTSSIMSRH